MNQRLSDLSAMMHLEPAEEVGCTRVASSSAETKVVKNTPYFVSHAILPNGKNISLLKTLLTSACERNCYYCPFRVGRDFRRATLRPDEMARAFMALHRSGIVEGIFLSSGIAGGSIYTQDKLLATAEILRFNQNFRGYIHLKLMPGAEKAQVERAMQLADRLSLNLEAPNAARWVRLSRTFHLFLSFVSIAYTRLHSYCVTMGFPWGSCHLPRRVIYR